MRIEALDISSALQGRIFHLWQYLEPVAVDPESSPLDYARANPVKFSNRLIIEPQRQAKTKAMQEAQLKRLGLHGMLERLQIHQNKLFILKRLHRRDWLKILHLLPKPLLVNALRLFNQKKLMLLLLNLPKRLLIQVLLEIFKLEELVQKMPLPELLRIFRNSRINLTVLAKAILTLEPRFIRMLLEKLYGNHDYSKLKSYDLMRIFLQTPKGRLMEAFKTMPFKPLQQMLLSIIKQDPEVMLSMSDFFIFKLLEKCPKPNMVEACHILPPDILIKMLSALPEPLLILAAAQLDDTSFGNYLLSEHSSLIEALASSIA